MSNTLKVVIGVAAALLVGLLVGYVVGSSGKRDLQQQVEREKSRGTEAEAALKQQTDECDRKSKAARGSRNLLLAKEQLLRALVELYANNYGLTSQHLGVARSYLRGATAGLSKSHAKTVQDLTSRIEAAQALSLKLDAMARSEVEQILGELQKLPGAR